MTARIGINGFGRIGRASLKIAFEDPDIEVVAINDLSNPRVLAHLLKYDTAYGIYDKEIYIEENGKKILLEDSRGDKDFFTQTSEETYLVVDNKKIKIFSEPEPAKIPWGTHNVDVVLECTGRFEKDGAAKAHLEGGAKKVVISAPAKGGDIQTFLRGVNDSNYLGQNVISNASCTTNCISPVIDIIHKNFKVLKAGLTTIHALTANQNIVDGPPDSKKPDLRRSRAGGYNMVPTTTGAAIATTQVIPDLQNIFDGIAIRVPILTGSVSDLTILVEKETSVEEINAVFEKAVENPIYQKVLRVTYEPIVSSDIVGDEHSAIVDLSMTKVIDGNLVKILAWYDNEWGYSHRLVEMAKIIGSVAV
jgi:glyceraldehyde 3-phosphate dehydrogenase